MFEGSESSELKRDEFIADSSNPRDLIVKGRVVDQRRSFNKMGTIET